MIPANRQTRAERGVASQCNLLEKEVLHDGRNAGERTSERVCGRRRRSRTVIRNTCHIFQQVHRYLGRHGRKNRLWGAVKTRTGVALQNSYSAWVSRCAEASSDFRSCACLCSDISSRSGIPTKRRVIVGKWLTLLAERRVEAPRGRDRQLAARTHPPLRALPPAAVRSLLASIFR